MKRTPFWLLFALLAAVALVWGGYWFVLVCSEDRADVRGQFGDMFGALSALFSGLGFAGLIFTILQQKDLIREQGKELEDAAERQTKSIVILTRQTRSLEVSAGIHALDSRLARYDKQISDLEKMPAHMEMTFGDRRMRAPEKVAEMMRERHTMTEDLDRLKEKAVRLALET